MGMGAERVGGSEPTQDDKAVLDGAPDAPVNLKTSRVGRPSLRRVATAKVWKRSKSSSGWSGSSATSSVQRSRSSAATGAVTTRKFFPASLVRIDRERTR